MRAVKFQLEEEGLAARRETMPVTVSSKRRMDYDDSDGLPAMKPVRNTLY